MIKDNKITINLDGREVELELTKEQVEKLTKKKRKVWKPKHREFYWHISSNTGKTSNYVWDADNTNNNEELNGDTNE